jgi:hypothetical protein
MNEGQRQPGSPSALSRGSSRPAPPGPASTPRVLGGHNLKRGVLNTGMDRNIHPTCLKQVGRHKTYAVLDAYLKLDDPFEGHPLNGAL